MCWKSHFLSTNSFENARSFLALLLTNASPMSPMHVEAISQFTACMFCWKFCVLATRLSLVLLYYPFDVLSCRCWALAVSESMPNVTRKAAFLMFEAILFAAGCHRMLWCGWLRCEPLHSFLSVHTVHCAMSSTCTITFSKTAWATTSVIYFKIACTQPTRFLCNCLRLLSSIKHIYIFTPVHYVIVSKHI